jgi:NAD(P) transhydrogenase
MPALEDFGLVVIGAGPAGTAAAATASRLGKRVAVVERAAAVGGAAVNTGTVPSKTLRETALALSGLRTRALYGVDLSLRRGATVADFLRHERAVRVGEGEQLRGRLAALGVAVFRGTGRFADPHTVRVTGPDGEVSLRGEAIVIAIGSCPVRPPVFPFEHDRVHDSDELLDLRALPTSLAVVGAGVIGSEYACMFAALGVPTHLIDGRGTLLPFLDAELSAALETAMRDLGVTFVWNETVAACEAPADGDVRLTLASGRVLSVDQVLVCAGRTSRTAELEPAAGGLVLADKGRLAVDAHYRTNVPHVYAVGDVIGFPALASTSAEQGRVAACHACGSDVLTAVSAVLPAGIYTIPEVSSAGETEEALRARGAEYVVGRAEYAQTPRGKIIGDRTGFLKLLFAPGDLRLLGVHVIGELATEVVHPGVLALTAGATADLFIRTCFNYPTLGELYKIASYDALLRSRGMTPFS